MEYGNFDLNYMYKFISSFYNCYSYSVQGSAGYGPVPDFQGLRKYTMEYGNFDLNYMYKFISSLKRRDNEKRTLQL